MPYLTRIESTWELYLGAEGVELDPDNPENRFSTAWIAEVNDLLATVEADPSGALVITATGKFFSNGLDVASITSAETVGPYIDSVHAVFARVLSLPVPTVAAVNGHAFGAGAMLPLCADHRIMRDDRGFWSLPEVVMGIPIPLGMMALLAARLPDATLTEAATTGRRYGGAECAAAGIVEEAVSQADLMVCARDVAAARTQFAGANLATIKKGLRRSVLADLAVPHPTA
ncbi:enoyl-CoA hydratase/isomerase family protein [Williamsia sp. CHRR-6]|uniref:enoyl-CoA hydratase/isomerase family protein n=1 Tax=Williamsia sp. CHRR-6 TaxID=2835871 RepID=UPI001BDB2548|nr:enoyl-CoA hydratase/isomerase family protein [Williamsia sp. CHRR-6]MBT0566845.1 enoyl-CoA hydratase/isomerase family protein [Williamsia sp. CHRR-6]